MFKYPRDLMEGLRHNDEKALAYLHDTRIEYLQYVAYAITQDQFESQDIALGAIHKAWNNRTRYKNQSHLEASLFLYTRNESVNFLRKKKVRDARTEDLTYLAAGPEEVEDLEDKPDLDQMLQKIHEVARNLPEKQRRVFELHVMNLTFHEIAEQAGTTPSTARNNHKKALNNLRKLLGIKILLFILWKLNG